MTSSEGIAGIVLIAGSILFLVAAFMPISMAFFPESDPARQLEIALNDRNGWIVSQILFASGTAVAAIGLGLGAQSLRATPGARLAYLAFAAAAVGAALWVWHVYLRADDPRALVEGTLPAWHFVAYTLLTQAALLLFGVALLRSPLPAWVGWMLIGGAIFFFLVYLTLKDMPPFSYYLLLLVTGAMLVRLGWG